MLISDKDCETPSVVFAWAVDTYRLALLCEDHVLVPARVKALTFTTDVNTPTNREVYILPSGMMENRYPCACMVSRKDLKFVPVASKQPVEDEERTIAQISTSVTVRHLYEKKRVKTGFLNHPGVQITSIRQSMELKSRHLIKALRDIVIYYPSVNLDNRSVSLTEPFCILAHYMPELEEYRNKLTQDLKKLAEEESDSSDKPTSSRQLEDEDYDATQMACRHINKMLSFRKSNI